MVLPRYYLVLDFEATCLGETNPAYFPHEIIYFAALLVNAEEKQVDSKFETRVRPEINPTLTDFCMKLIGVTQAMVNCAPTFTEALGNFEHWMKEKGLTTDNFVIVTDGPWDLAKNLHTQCALSNIPYPKWAEKWLSVRNTFRKSFAINYCTLSNMLSKLGLSSQGRKPESDSLNIAQILLKFIKNGLAIHKPNEHIALGDYGYTLRRKSVLRAAIAIVESQTDETSQQLLKRLKNALDDTTQDSRKVVREIGEDSIIWTNNNKFLPSSTALKFGLFCRRGF